LVSGCNAAAPQFSAVAGRGLAQFFGGGRSKAGEEVDAENLCLTPSNCDRPSNSVNGYLQV